MKLILSPQRSDYTVQYDTAGDALKVRIGEQIDTFDLSKLPDGCTTEFDTHLPICPLLYVIKSEDEINVSALDFYGPDEAAELQNQYDMQSS